MTCEDFEEISGAYVLDAVTPEERVEADEHLAHCPHCTLVLQELRSVVDVLPLAVPLVEPPPTAKARVFFAVQNAATIASRPTQSIPARRGQPVRRRSRWQRWGTQIAAAAAVLFFALFGGMTAWNISLQHQLTGLSSTNHQLQQQVSTLTYKLEGTATTPAVSGQLVYIAKENITILVMHGLPQLEGSHVYQGWLIRDKQPTSVGLLNTYNGIATVNFPGNVKGFDLAAVSLEPGPAATLHAPKGVVLATGALKNPTHT